MKRIIIIGAGTSMQEAIEKKDLWNNIKDETTIALNYAIRYFPNPTIVSYVDASFYAVNSRELEKYPLVITRLPNSISKPNFISLKASANEYFGKDSIEKGFYSLKLAGLFSLTYSIFLGFKEIYLLGFDFGSIDNKVTTHFYQGNFLHRGVGFKSENKKYNTMLYDRPADNYFGFYKQELDRGIKIINVSPKSNINTFPKIDYDQFFDILKKDRSKTDPNETREYIKKRFKGIPTEEPNQNIEIQAMQQGMIPTMQPTGEIKENKDQSKPQSFKGTILN